MSDAAELKTKPETSAADPLPTARTIKKPVPQPPPMRLVTKGGWVMREEEYWPDRQEKSNNE